MQRHVRKNCKIAPNEENQGKGLEVLHEHTIRAMQAELAHLREEVAALRNGVGGGGTKATARQQVAAAGGTIVNGDQTVYNVTLRAGPDKLNLDMLTPQFIYDAMVKSQSLDDGFQACFEKVVCNPDYPENGIVFLVNRNDSTRALLWKGTWHVLPASGALKEIHLSILDDMLDMRKQPQHPETERALTAMDGAPPSQALCKRYTRVLKGTPHKRPPKNAILDAQRRVAGPRVTKEEIDELGDLGDLGDLGPEFE